MPNPFAAAVTVLRRLAGRNEGQIAILFALGAITLIVAAGIAVDVARAYTVRVRLGAALDAAVLAVGSELNQNAATLTQDLNNYFAANYPGTALGTRTEELDAALATVRSSTVALHVVRGGGASTVMGVVAEAGGMVATSARGIAGATRITAVEPDGTREAAVVVGVDRTSDLAVVRVPDDLPAANLDDAALGTGAATAAVMLRPRRHAAPTSLVYAGTVVASSIPTTCPLLSTSGHPRSLPDKGARTAVDAKVAVTLSPGTVVPAATTVPA